MYVCVCLHVCVQVQPLRMGGQDPQMVLIVSHNPKMRPFLKSGQMPTVPREVLLTSCSLLSFLSFLSLGRASSNGEWGEIYSSQEEQEKRLGDPIPPVSI